MKRIITIQSFVIIILLVFAGIIGCESESSSEAEWDTNPDNGLNISPSTASVSPGQKVTFTASGGYNYTWSLDNESKGTISPTTGPTTTFTSSATNSLIPMTITLTLTSTILDTSYSQSTKAFITHL